MDKSKSSRRGVCKVTNFKWFFPYEIIQWVTFIISAKFSLKIPLKRSHKPIKGDVELNPSYCLEVIVLNVEKIVIYKES